jgi:hypothetical protein
LCFSTLSGGRAPASSDISTLVIGAIRVGCHVMIRRSQST